MMGACSAIHAQESGASSEKARLRAIQLEAASLTTTARLLGRALFGSYRDPQVDNSEVAQTALKTATAAVRDLCEASYQAILIRRPGVPLEPPDTILAYLIGDVPGDQDVMLGRHYRVELSPDGKTVRSIVPSTMECTYLLLSNLTEARYITHPLSPGATEFHVFLTLLHKTKFRVRTAMGIWEIDNGDVRLRAVDPTYTPKPILMRDCLLPNGTKFATTEARCRDAGGSVLD